MRHSVNKMLHRRIPVRAIATMALAAGVSSCARVPEVSSVAEYNPMTPFKQSCTAAHPQYGSNFAFARIDIEGSVYRQTPNGTPAILIKHVRSTPLKDLGWFAGQPSSELDIYTSSDSSLENIKTPTNGQETRYGGLFMYIAPNGYLPWGTATVYYIEAGLKKSATCNIPAKYI
ncbi:hypothetical protein [Pseudomonas fluorescens]|nr:hypothetical protein [Pseudomonas fluorescens]